MKGFFPMKKGTIAVVVVVLIYCIAVCTPWAVKNQWANVAVNVWLSILGTFVFSAISIILLLAERPQLSKQKDSGVKM